MSAKSNILHCGIDFGTTNSSLSVSTNNTPKVLPIDPHNSNPFALKSLLYVNQTHQFSFGSEAINKYLFDLETLPSIPPQLKITGRQVKVMVPTGSGTMKADLVPEIIEVDDSGRGRLIQSLKSVLTSQNFIGTTIFNQFFSLEDLLSLLLTKIKTNAENLLDHHLDSVVLGRPVRYVGTGADSVALNRMLQIGKRAGFKHIEFEYEPVGAALNYGINLNQDQTILVYDFGGGTLDVCIMKFPESKVISVSGRGVGGDLINARLLESKISPHFGAKALINGRVHFPKYFIVELSTWYRSTLLKTVKNIETLKDLQIKSNQPRLINNLIELIINDYGFTFFNTLDLVKINLSTADQTIFSFHHPHLSINQDISRTDLESAIYHEITASQDCIFEALKSASLQPADIDSVILTGGSSQIPVFINQIKSIFDPSKIIVSDHFTAVAAGLSLRAEQLFS